MAGAPNTWDSSLELRTNEGLVDDSALVVIGRAANNCKARIGFEIDALHVQNQVINEVMNKINYITRR